MSMKLVKPTKSDASLILEWENDPRYYDELFYEGPYRLEDIEVLLESMVALNSEQVRYLVQNEGVNVGVIDLCEIDYDKKEAFVTILIVEEENRRKGFGTRSLQLLEEKAKALGIRQLFAWIRNENLMSKDLFLKAGYRKSLVKKELIVDGVAYIHVTLFEKCLNE